MEKVNHVTDQMSGLIVGEVANLMIAQTIMTGTHNRTIEDKTLTLPSLVTRNIVGVLINRLFDLVSGTSAAGLN